MTSDETAKLTALGDRYREVRSEVDRLQQELGETESRRRQLQGKLADLRGELDKIVGDVEPIFAGIQAERDRTEGAA